MTYYVAYNKNLGNALVGISQEPISPPNEDIAIETLSGDLPDMSRHFWNTSTLMMNEYAATSSKLTKLEYMNRFTDAELATIYTVAKTNVQVEVWLEKFKASSEVDVTDPRTVAGVQALEAVGLIQIGRAAEILA